MPRAPQKPRNRASSRRTLEASASISGDPQSDAEKRRSEEKSRRRVDNSSRRPSTKGGRSDEEQPIWRSRAERSEAEEEAVARTEERSEEV
jgi:hypothetical protein